VTGEKDTRAFQWKNMHPDQRATLFAIADSNLVSQFATGYLYADREFKKEDNGTATFSILFYKAAWDAWSGEDIDSWTFLRYGNRGRDRATLLKTWTGIAIDDADDALNAVSTNTNFITSGYAVTDAYYTDNKDESVNVIQAQTQTGLTDMASSKSITAFGVETSKTDENMTSAIVAETNHTAGLVVITRNIVNADGFNDHTYFTNAVTADVLISTNRALGIMSDTYSYTTDNQTNALTNAVEVTNGVITEHSTTVNKFGRNKNTVSRDVANKNVTNHYVDAAGILSVQHTETVANTTNDVETASAVTNGVISTRTTIVSKYGLNDTTTGTDTARPDVQTSTNRTLGVMSDVYLSITDNQTNALTNATEVTNGVITTHESDLNKFGMNVNTIGRDVANKNVTNAHTFAITQFNSIGSQTIANQTNGTTSGTAVANGVITTIKDDLNKWNLHDIMIQTNKALAATGVKITRTITPFETTSTTNSINQTNATAWMVASNRVDGTTLTQTVTTNDHGLVDQSFNTKVSTQNVTNGNSIARTAFSTVGSESVANTTNGVNAGTAVSDGTITIVKKTKTPDGLWDMDTSTNHAIAVSGFKVSKTFTAFNTTTSTNSINLNPTNATAWATNQTTGTILSHTIETNDHGLVDETFSVDTAEPDVTNRQTSVVTIFRDDDSITVLNQTSNLVDGTVVANGTITTESAILNEYGEWENTTATSKGVTNTADNTAVSGVNKPGLWPGLLTNIVTKYRNYALPFLPDGTDPTTSNNYILNKRTGPDERGLYGRINVELVPVWDGIWATNKLQVGEDNPNGWAHGEVYEIGDVDKDDLSTLIAAMITEDTNRVVKSVRIREGENGSLTGVQIQGHAFTNTTSAGATEVEWVAATGDESSRLSRFWPRRASTATDTLTATNGAARSDYGDFEHRQCRIVDHGDNTFTVHQSLVNTNDTQGIITVYWKKDWEETKVNTRSSDNLTKTITYEKHVKRISAAEFGWDAINDAVTGTIVVVFGSSSVRQVAQDVWEARWTEFNTSSGVGIWQ